jgi:hypothetical protein
MNIGRIEDSLFWATQGVLTHKHKVLRTKKEAIQDKIRSLNSIVTLLDSKMATIGEEKKDLYEERFPVVVTVVPTRKPREVKVIDHQASLKKRVAQLIMAGKFDEAERLVDQNS